MTQVNLCGRHPLIILMREDWVTRPKVDGGNAESGEPCHVGPAVFGGGLAASKAKHYLGKADGKRRVEARAGTCGNVGDHYLEAIEQLADMSLGLLRGAGRREPKVDRDNALVWNDVPGNAATNGNGIHALPED